MDFKSFDEIDRLTIPQYELMMEAVRLKLVDADYRSHLDAWLSFAAKAKKSAGKNKQKPVYDKFKKFYDYEKELDKAKKRGNEKSRFSGFGKFLRKDN